MTTRSMGEGAARVPRARRSVRAALAALGLAFAAGCGGLVGGPPSLSSDPCLACRQNCSLTGRMCGSSSASEMACRSKLADCEYKCRKRYCPREKDSSDPEDAETPSSEPAAEAAP